MFSICLFIECAIYVCMKIHVRYDWFSIKKIKKNSQSHERRIFFYFGAGIIEFQYFFLSFYWIFLFYRKMKNSEEGWDLLRGVSYRVGATSILTVICIYIVWVTMVRQWRWLFMCYGLTVVVCIIWNYIYTTYYYYYYKRRKIEIQLKWKRMQTSVYFFLFPFFFFSSTFYFEKKNSFISGRRLPCVTHLFNLLFNCGIGEVGGSDGKL